MRNPFKRKKRITEDPISDTFTITITGEVKNEEHTSTLIFKKIEARTSMPVFPVLPSTLYTWASQFILGLVEDIKQTEEDIPDENIKPS